DGRYKQTLGVVRGCWDDHLEAWHVGEEGLHRLGVVERAVDATAEGRANHERHIPVIVTAVTHLCRFAHDLVEGGVNEVGELHLGDRFEPIQGGADGDSGDR